MVINILIYEQTGRIVKVLYHKARLRAILEACGGKRDRRWFICFCRTRAVLHDPKRIHMIFSGYKIYP